MHVKSKLAGLAVAALVAAAFAAQGAPASKNTQRMVEDYVAEPMPPGVQVVLTERDGPVFADAQGHTFYEWPHRGLRIGAIGDYPGKSSCTDQRDSRRWRR